MNLLFKCVFATLLLSLSSCDRVNVTPSAPPALPPISDIGAKTGLAFSPGAKVLYYHEDSERILGLKEWVIEDSAFNSLSTPLSSVIEGRFLDSAVDHMEVYIGKGKVADPIRSFHASWTNSIASFECTLLETKHTKYIYILKHP